MVFKIASSPYTHNQRQTSRIMMLVVIAALPGILVQSWFFGWGTVIQLMLAIITAWLAESLVLRLRKQNVVQTLADNSALLTGLLLAISIPPFAPWWMVVLGTVFAVIIAKQLYGGLGQNPFNPAMIGYVVLLISFPVQMTSWLPPHEIAASTPGFIDAVQMIFTGHTVAGQDMNALKMGIDGISQATPLDTFKTSRHAGQPVEQISTALSIMAHWPASAGSGSILRIWWVACFCCKGYSLAYSARLPGQPAVCSTWAGCCILKTLLRRRCICFPAQRCWAHSLF
jgi:electron transport complex protein RnfD